MIVAAHYGIETRLYKISKKKKKFAKKGPREKLFSILAQYSQEIPLVAHVFIANLNVVGFPAMSWNFSRCEGRRRKCLLESYSRSTIPLRRDLTQ